jgi:hypothetical protein
MCVVLWACSRERGQGFPRTWCGSCFSVGQSTRADGGTGGVVMMQAVQQRGECSVGQSIVCKTCSSRSE